MKKYIVVTMLILSLCVVGHTQITPQFSFHAQSDNGSLLSKYKDNDYMTHLASQLLLLFGVDSNKEKVQLLHRMYEIEHTSLIHYMTNDGNPLDLKTDSDTLAEKIEVDFGAILEANSKSNEEFRLWFSSPVTKIDPVLFASSVTYIKLPDTDQLEYGTSITSCATNLACIKGKDVIDERSLVDANGRLIVAAVAGLTAFTIPQKVVTIGRGAFRGSLIKDIVLPENVERIEEAAFELCENLESVTILASNPIEISESAFDNSKSFKYKIFVPNQCYKTYRKMYPTLKRRFKKIN